jgi:hypothetical protein
MGRLTRWIAHRFVIVGGDVECRLELSDHIGNTHSFEVHEIGDDEERACVLTG